MKYYIWAIGCQMNISDAERVASVLENLGYRKTLKENEADLIVVLACSVRQSAIDRIFGKAKRFSKLKIKNPRFKTILTGCVLPEDKPKMEKIFDIVFDIKNLKKLPKFLKSIELEYSDYFKIKPVYNSSFQAFVPIMTGCNNFCSYCAVPYTRGREKSRSEKDILDEIENLIKKGYKEITLLGQNVNSYGITQKTKHKRQKTKNKFAELLRKINKIPGKFWIRFLTSNPQDMSFDLIKAIKECDKVTKYIHLPVQSGNNEILKRMNRKYTREHYLKLVSQVREEIPDVAISTDTIVGFPGETKKQFNDTLDLYKKVGFDMAYIAQYSPRPGTAAFKMKDDVPKKEKKRREKELTKILKKTALENNKKYIGRVVEVLVEKENKNFLFGRTQTFKLVQFKGPKKIIGSFAKVKINSCTPWGLSGELLSTE